MSWNSTKFEYYKRRIIGLELIYYIVHNIDDILFYLGTYLGVPSFLFSLVALKKIIKTHPLLFIITFEQVATPVIGVCFIDLFGSNYLSYTIDNALWMLFLFLSNKSLPRYTNYFFLVLIAQEIVHVIWFPSDIGVLIYFQLSIFAILICAMNIYNLGLTSTDKNITKNPYFLINTGVIFYFALSLVSFLFFNILVQGPFEYFLVILVVQAFAAVTLHSFLFLSIWRINWK